jgi:hypothetical protein
VLPLSYGHCLWENRLAYFALYKSAGISASELRPELVLDGTTDQNYYAILDVLLGLAYADPLEPSSRFGFIHGDATIGNVFLDIGNYSFTIGDYGYAVYFDKVENIVISPRYALTRFIRA